MTPTAQSVHCAFFLVFVHAIALLSLFFFFTDPATTEIYTLSLHDALPICGYGTSADAWHLVAGPEDGAGSAAAISRALSVSGLALAQIQHVNAHATSTPHGDRAEIAALRKVFGAQLGSIPVSATKSATGHLLGAAGGVEAVFTVMSLYDQVSSPTINIDNQDPDCDLDYTANSARDKKIDVAISNSFGFGGTNGTILFKKI